MKITGYTELDVYENSRLYNIDCIEAMKQYPDKYFDLAIVDPPYGINATKMNMGSSKKYGREYKSTNERLKGRLNLGGGKLKNRILNKSNIDWDNKIPSEEYFIELFRVSKNQIIWGGNYFNLIPTRCIIVWDKKQVWENFSQHELAWTSFDKPAKLFSLGVTGGDNKEIKIHPTQKPVVLYDYCLEKFSKIGDKILDTHVGSASSRIACYKRGFDFTGFELDSNYFQDSVIRFKNFLGTPIDGEKQQKLELF